MNDQLTKSNRNIVQQINYIYNYIYICLPELI